MFLTRPSFFRRLSPAIAWLMLGALAVVSCAGQGLHLLPGMGHSGTGHCHAASVSHPGEHRHSATGCHAHVHRTSDSSEHRHVASGVTDGLRLSAAVERCADDCAICAYMAQGQLSGLMHDTLPVERVVPFSPIEPPTPCVADHPRANPPRGPPC